MKQNLINNVHVHVLNFLEELIQNDNLIRLWHPLFELSVLIVSYAFT